MQEIRIEKASIADTVAVLAVQKAAFEVQGKLYETDDLPPLRENAAQFAEALESWCILKARLDSRVIGSVRGKREGEVCHVARLSVAPDLQNRVIGRRLMQAIEEVFDDCPRIEPFTGARSSKNLALYERLGYVRSGEGPEGGRIPIVFLQKTPGNRSVVRNGRPVPRSGGRKRASE